MKLKLTEAYVLGLLDGHLSERCDAAEKLADLSSQRWPPYDADESDEDELMLPMGLR